MIRRFSNRRAIGRSMLAGCSMMPAYQRPAAPVPVALPQGASYPALPSADGAIDAIGWHTFFTDARLQRVIGDALANNRDLRASVANVAAARAQYRIADAARLPTITAGPSLSRYHGSVGSSGFTGGYGDSTGVERRCVRRLGRVASFELDLWGRVRSLSKAALETWLASDEGRKSAQIALVAQVAQAWLTIGADADALGVARDTLASRNTTLDRRAAAQCARRRHHARSGAGRNADRDGAVRCRTIYDRPGASEETR